MTPDSSTQRDRLLCRPELFHHGVTVKGSQDAGPPRDVIMSSEHQDLTTLHCFPHIYERTWTCMAVSAHNVPT